ncbi:hypothetical protein PUN28_019084 [Cardiocondyla obscurior]|uniref:Uncharacterized protein n=1 Tax=Cardiocondyla obscurior TaxID=286306 RepID=A0AAW2ED95_9HYME
MRRDGGATGKRRRRRKRACACQRELNGTRACTVHEKFHASFPRSYLIEANPACVSVNEADVDKWRVSPRETRAQAIFRARCNSRSGPPRRGLPEHASRARDPSDSFDCTSTLRFIASACMYLAHLSSRALRKGLIFSSVVTLHLYVILR